MTTYIADSLFRPRPAIHANGDRHSFVPANVQWDSNWWDDDRDAPLLSVRSIWYTDGHVPDFSTSPGQRGRIKTIGLLLQPAEFDYGNYRAAEEALTRGDLDVLFTHDPGYFGTTDEDHRFRVYPLGGTRIHESDWRLWEKSLSVSAIASRKRGLPGHWMRHEVISAFLGYPRFYAFGPDYSPLPHVLDLQGKQWESKLPALASYMFSVAIEPTDAGYFLSEHVLDCFLTGTMPIYWGPPDALKHWGFDEQGVLRGRYKDDMMTCVREALDRGSRLYEERWEAIQHNFIRAHEFTCPEDWLFREHTELFR